MKPIDFIRHGLPWTLAVLLLAIARGARADLFDAQRAHALAFASQQLTVTVAEVGDATRFPRSTQSNGTWTTADSRAWTSGFFPGCLWLMGEATGEETWFDHARAWTAAMEREKTDTSSHDVGFKIFCSFGNGYRVTGDAHYAAVIRTGAQSLATRYSSVVGCTRSWNNYTFPVIIDNMMNLEILLWGAAHGGVATWHDMAVSHGLRTRVEHVRSDGTTYHLVDFDPATGAVLARRTVQGSSHESTWARGQAWGLYGFTMAYRETQDARFLQTASLLADWFIEHLPADHVPYWDFEAPNIPMEEKDSSAAAIAASGLLELSTLTADEASRARYWGSARDILASLCSPAYLAEGTTSRGILLHGVGNHPANSEVDVSLIYGDYYFLEALARYAQVANDATSLPGETSGLAIRPNPSHTGFEIQFQLPKTAPASLRIYDVRGRVVRTVSDDAVSRASRVVWNGQQDDGSTAPSGTYFCVLQTQQTTLVRRLTWLR
jgi:unsaturated chondroitin disaccharide hydrolase